MRYRQHRDCIFVAEVVRELHRHHRKRRRSFERNRARKIRSIERQWRSVTCKGGRMGSDQRSVTKRVLEVGHEVGANRRVRISAQATITVEAVCRNLAYGDLDSLGPFQQRTSWPGSATNVRNASVNYYLRAPTYPGGAIAYERNHPGASIGQIAQAIQRSAFPSRYDQVAGEAKRTVRAYHRLRSVR